MTQPCLFYFSCCPAKPADGRVPDEDLVELERAPVAVELRQENFATLRVVANTDELNVMLAWIERLQPEDKVWSKICQRTLP